MRGQSLYDYCMEHEDKRYLLDEWAYEKNEKEFGLNPQNITYGSGKQAYWFCNICNKLYLSAICRRTNQNSGCVDCSIQRRVLSRMRNNILAGNDLASNYPELVKEWDYEKNGDLTPDTVSKGSKKKVWWLCSKGHSYAANISSRSKNNTGCPYCDGKKVLKGFNDLATTHPHLLKEWDYDKNKVLGYFPDNVISLATKKVYWICNACGYNWATQINNRKRGHGCPRCASELKSSFSEQAIYYYLMQSGVKVLNRVSNLIDGDLELDIYLPDMNVAIEYDGVIYHKDVERDLKKNKLCKMRGIRLIRIREYGLPNIDGSFNLFRLGTSDIDLQNVLVKLFSILNLSVNININRDRTFIYSQYIKSVRDNSLAIKFPEVAKYWHPSKNGTLKPVNVSYSSNKEVWWVCDKGHEYSMVINRKTNNGQCCPICAGKRVISGANDLLSNAPEIAKWWHPSKNGSLTPKDVTAHSGKEVWWKCEKGHEWSAVIDTLVRKNNGCPYCSNHKILKGFNDLQTLYPEIVQDWDYDKNAGLLPSEVSYGSARKVNWKCNKCGYEWCTSISVRTKGHGCPMCANKRKGRKG